MDIKNIDKAEEMIPRLKSLTRARGVLSDTDARIEVTGKAGCAELPRCLRLNILNVVNCEYERVRKEIKEL